MTEQQLVGVLRRLIDDNKLREQHGEDTMGVLMKCGAFREAPGDDNFIVDLAHAIEIDAATALVVPDVALSSPYVAKRRT